MPEDPITSKPSRRQALKALAAATGAASLASLPTRWSKPWLRFGLLPVHAQASLGCEAPGALFASATWDSFSNIDLFLTQPNGFIVHPNNGAPVNGDGAVSPTTGATHSGDVTTTGTETITIPPGGAFNDPGQYALVLYNPGPSPIQVAVAICTECVVGYQVGILVQPGTTATHNLSFNIDDERSGCFVIN